MRSNFPAKRYLRLKSEKSDLRVLFLPLYPETMPSSRLRVYQYVPFLQAAGINVTVIPALPEPWFSRLYYSRSKWSRVFQYTAEFLNSFSRVLRSRDYDVVFIQKGLLLSNLRGMERLFARAGRRLIFDLDDNVYGANIMEFSRPIFRMIQDPDQAGKLSKHCRAVVAGNAYLGDLARKYNRNVFVIPTPVDTDRLIPSENQAPRAERREIVVGWSGMASTALTYFSLVADALREISRRYPVRLRLLTRLHGRPFHLDGVKVEVVDWSYENEASEMQRFDLAIAPLEDDAWSRGKCSFRLLTYMSAGIPAVASRAGANCELLEDGRDGFLAGHTDEWVSKLSRLIEDEDLRRRMGAAARKKAVEHYSVKKAAVSVADIIRQVGLS